MKGELHPLVKDAEGNPEPFVWVTLPNYEPGHFLAGFDTLGEFTTERERMEVILALDRFVLEWQFKKQPHTFNKPRFI